MTKKNAAKIEARARQKALGGRYMMHLRDVRAEQDRRRANAAQPSAESVSAETTAETEDEQKGNECQ